jgi:hypothetical protein
MLACFQRLPAKGRHGWGLYTKKRACLASPLQLLKAAGKTCKP